MLINALCEYYDELEKDGKVVPDGYSEQAVHYLIALTSDGKIEDILNYQIKEKFETKNGKLKEKENPRIIMMPLRTEKTGICSNIIEHRPLYIFGLNYDKYVLTSYDKTNKAKKSNDAFKKSNLEFIEGLDSPIINAYRNFILNWIPENETENPALVNIGKAYKNSYFAFCLSGHIDVLLHEDVLIKKQWNKHSSGEDSEQQHYSQCAVTGKKLPVARIHNKIKGIYGGLASGTVLIGYKGSAGCSYGNEQSYNSNISTEVMKKYTYALNTLLSDGRHKTLLDDVTVIYWATGKGADDRHADLFDSFMFGGNNNMDEQHTDKLLSDLFARAGEGRVTANQISSLGNVDDNVDFYIVGLKPNSSRVSMKFIYRRKYADILLCIAQHQSDMWIFDAGLKRGIQTIALWQLKNELKSLKSKNDTVDASLLSEIFKSVLYGTEYPTYLLSTIVTRIKTDRYINRIRAGTIKACINRKLRILNKEEEIKVALDKNNTNQAYLCGRLFAILERIQKNAATAKLNRTIKDAYFASAASKPALVFPKLLTLSNNHAKKLDEKSNVFFNKLIEEIIGKLDGQFPDTLMLTDQGRFMIGYYQQEQDFYKKSEDKIKEENES